MDHQAPAARRDPTTLWTTNVFGLEGDPRRKFAPLFNKLMWDCVVEPVFPPSAVDDLRGVSAMLEKFDRPEHLAVHALYYAGREFLHEVAGKLSPATRARFEELVIRVVEQLCTEGPPVLLPALYGPRDKDLHRLEMDAAINQGREVLSATVEKADGVWPFQLTVNGCVVPEDCGAGIERGMQLVGIRGDNGQMHSINPLGSFDCVEFRGAIFCFGPHRREVWRAIKAYKLFVKRQQVIEDVLNGSTSVTLFLRKLQPRFNRCGAPPEAPPYDVPPEASSDDECDGECEDSANCKGCCSQGKCTSKDCRARCSGQHECDPGWYIPCLICEPEHEGRATSAAKRARHD